MDYLIDTHVCLWAIANKGKLSVKARSILENNFYKIFVSQISFLEIAIKPNIGKLPEFEVTLQAFIASVYATGFEVLPLKDGHFVSYSTFIFSPGHRDPFDRYLITTPSCENMAIISADEKFRNYIDLVNIIW